MGSGLEISERTTSMLSPGDVAASALLPLSAGSGLSAEGESGSGDVYFGPGSPPPPFRMTSSKPGDESAPSLSDVSDFSMPSSGLSGTSPAAHQGISAS